jgi:hypothetical protein
MIAAEKSQTAEHHEDEKHGTFANVPEDDSHGVLKTILKEQPIKTWSRGSLHLYAVCLLVYLCSTMNGPSRTFSTRHRTS